MAIKNAIYQVDNGSGFDEIHFKTKADQVACKNGESAEVALGKKMNNTKGSESDKFNSIAVGNSSKAQNGFNTSTNGTIEQFGLVTITGSQITVTLPIAFLTKHNSVSVTIVDAAITTATSVWVVGQNLTTLTIRASRPCTVEWRSFGW